MSSRLTATVLPLAGVLACLALACNTPPKSDADKAKAEAKDGGDQAEAEAGDAKAEAGEAAEAEQKSPEIDRFVAWLPKDVLAASYDRLGERFDPDTVAVVFGVPPKAADLLDERKVLDESLEIVLSEEALAADWLADSTMAFTTPLSNTPYFLRSLTKAPAEVEPLLEGSGFTKHTGEETGADRDVWLPSGAFPWRIVLLDEHSVAFIPADIPGTGLEPLLSAQGQANSQIEDEMTKALGEDPGIRLVLLSGGPLISYDLHASIAQVQLVLRKSPDEGLAGQIVLAPTGDLSEAINELNERDHPEENAQVQALIKGVAFQPLEGMAVGQLVLSRDQLKHLRD